MRIDPTNLTWDNMRRGIEAQPEIVRTLPHELHEKAQSWLIDRPPSKIYVVGCGDSLYCGMAARYAIERWCAIPTEAIQSLEFSRYAIRAAPPGSLVIGVSNSGKVARTVESLVYARQHGLKTIGITYDPESPLANASENLLTYSYKDTGFAPGTVSFAASLLAVLIGGLRISSSTLKADINAGEMLARITALADHMETTIEACEKPAAEAAVAAAGFSQMTFVGGGPNYGTALFGMAKVIESTGVHAVGQELEEWAHEHFFSTNPRTFTSILSCTGASSERAHEIARAASEMGSHTVAIGSPEDLALERAVRLVLPVTAREVDELLSPLVYSLPVALFAYELGRRSGKTMYGFDDRHRQRVNFQQIFESASPSSIPSLGGSSD